MKEVSIIGVDLAKQVFQLHGAMAEGDVVFRKKLSRKQSEQIWVGKISVTWRASSSVYRPRG